VSERAPVRLAGITDEAGPDLDTQIEVTRRLGWDAVELRNVDGRAVADLSDAAFGTVVDRLAAAGLGTVCVDSRIANWARPVTGPFDADLAELEVLAERCPALGTRYVRVMSYPNDGLSDADWGREATRRLRLLAARAERAGLVLLHENCAGWAGSSAARALQLLADVDSPALGLVFDTGNGLEYGYDARDMLAELLDGAADRVLHVQVKDADGTAEDPVYRYPGVGAQKVAEQLGLLAAAGYAGAVSIEPHMVVRPHDGAWEPGPVGADVFVEYGRRLGLLVARSGLGAGALVSP
jgi:sugar phosphate isomerase/epimerase